MKSPLQLSVVVPIYNEAKYLSHFLPLIISGVSHITSKFEIILCENGSTDATISQAKKLMRKYHQLKLVSSAKANYGQAVKTGFLVARGTSIVLFDLDYFDFDFLKQALDLLKTHDIVIASKNSPTSSDKRSLVRRTISKLFSLVLRLFFGYHFSDTHGMKVLDRSKITPLISSCIMTREIFDTELLIRAQLHGLSLTEVGISVSETRPSRNSIFKRALATIPNLLKLRLRLFYERPQDLLPLLLIASVFCISGISLFLPVSLIDEAQLLERSQDIITSFIHFDFRSLSWVIAEPDSGRIRPLYWLGFVFQYLLFGDHIFYYHLLRILVLTANTIFLFHLFTKITRKQIVAFLSSLLFLIFYRIYENYLRLGTQEPLMFFWLLLSLLHASPGNRLKSVFFFICALLTKETSVFFLPVIIVYDWYQHRQFNRYWLLYITACVIFTLAILSHRQAGDYASTYQPTLKNILASLSEYKSYLDGTYYSSLLKLSLVTIPFIMFYKKTLLPALAFGFFWFLSGLTILLSWPIPLGRYLYPVLPGLTLVFGLTIYFWLDFIRTHRFFVFPVLAVSSYLGANILLLNLTGIYNFASSYYAREVANYQLQHALAQLPVGDIYFNFTDDLDNQEWVDTTRMLSNKQFKKSVAITRVPDKLPSAGFLVSWNFEPERLPTATYSESLMPLSSIKQTYTQASIIPRHILFYVLKHYSLPPVVTLLRSDAFIWTIYRIQPTHNFSVEI